MNLLSVEFGQNDAKINRSKRGLGDLYVVVSPLFSVIKTDEYASVIRAGHN